MTSIPLHSRLHNDASVADWLHTAAGGANTAANLLMRVARENDEVWLGYGIKVGDKLTALDKAEDELERALSELRTVRGHLTHAHGVPQK